VSELRLSNVMVKTQRVEDYRPVKLFDTVISRAFSSIAEFVAVAGAQCRPGGVLLAMKGRYPEEELSGLAVGFQLLEVTRLSVPGLDEERHVVRLSRQ
jgi:16S rRNA (guanine527-N7)-methyltransferase